MQAPASASGADWLRRAAVAALLVVGSTIFAVPATAASTTGSGAGAWVVVGTGAALEIFDCGGLLCGRIAWLRKARDTAGRPVQDDENPDPAFRQRPLCGLTVLHGLRPAGPDRWNTALFTTRTTGRHTASRLNSVRPMSLLRAFISACRRSVRPRPCSGSRGSAWTGAAGAD